MKFIDCTYELHAPEILAIFNDVILNSTALWEYEARTLNIMKAWFEKKQQETSPLLVQLMKAANY